MIISSTHNFSFVHIPKNGGTTVRKAVGEFHDFPIRFKGRENLPELGEVFLGHLPLEIVRTRFPDAYAAFCATRSFALIRDPYTRFASSFTQTLRNNASDRPEYYTNAELLDACKTIIGELRKMQGPLLPIEYAMFMRQSDFLELNDEQIVTDIFVVKDIGLLMNEIAGLAGGNLEIESARNESVRFRDSGVARTAISISGALRRMLSPSLYESIRNMAFKVLAVKDNKTSEILLNDECVRGFVREYYNKDFQFLDATLQNRLAHF